MGKSDPLIFRDYIEMTQQLRPSSIAFLGFSKPNAFTDTLNAETKHFYDLTHIVKWDINSDWTLDQKYDLIVSTRCPYFARDPQTFLRKCKESLNPGGRIFVDWGLGDHWRFDKFKVGWVRDGEQEHAYAPGNFLHSCLWRKEFADDPVVRQFWSHVRGRFGYSVDEDLDQVVRQEIPSLIDYEFEKIRFRFLWPETPQLYIMTLI